MKFVARYVHRYGFEKEYWRTLYADGVNEAMRIAEKWTRKDFMLHSVVEA